MHTITEEEEEKEEIIIPPLSWWSPGAAKGGRGKKGGGDDEINIPLGGGASLLNSGANRRHTIAIPSSPFPFLSSSPSKPPRPFSPPLSPLLSPSPFSSPSASPSISALKPSPSLFQEGERENSLITSPFAVEPLSNNTTNNNFNENNNSAYSRNIDVRRKSEGDFTPPALSKEVFLREMAEREIMETETAYVKDLSICIEAYYLPMKTREILPKQDMEEIFLNIEPIANIHIELERELRAKGNIPLTFQKMTPFLRMYSNYCANGTKALQMLIRHKKNPTVDKFLKQCMENEIVKGQPLESYLIKPTQRLCKYPLLLQALLTNTEKGTLEYKELEQVLEQIKVAVLAVNEKKRQLETIQIIEELKSQIDSDMDSLFSKTTMFLKEGPLTVLGDTCTSFSFYLFDDLLLATKPAKKHKKKLVYSFGLDRALVKDVVKLDDTVPKTTFNIWTYQNNNKINIKLAASLEREKKSWIVAIEKAISAKAAKLHEMFNNISVDTKGNKQDWYLKRNIRLFGEDLVLKQDQFIQQLLDIRSSMQEDLDAISQRREKEDAETDVQKLKAILQNYKNEQAQKMARVAQLDLKLTSNVN